MRKLILSLTFGALGFLSFAQETNANILGSVEIGGTRYYVLQESGTGKYFKSEMTSINVLNYGDIVKLEQQKDENGFQQIKDASFNNLFKAKEEVSGNPNNGANYVDPAILFRLPKVYNGILVFENKKHFDELYNLIDNYLVSKKSIPGKKDALTLVESKIENYISFREHFQIKYPDEGPNDEGYTELEIEKIEKEDFFSDEILKFFLNKYRMVIIDKEVFYYHDFYTSLKYKFDFLNQFQNENERISLIENFDLVEGGSFLPFSKDVEVLSDILYISKDFAKDGKPSSDPLNPKFNITTTYAFLYSTDPCEYQTINFKVITLLDGVPFPLINPYQGELLVNWPVVTTVYGSSFPPNIPYKNGYVDHFNATPGTKNISYHLTFIYNGEIYDFKDGYSPLIYPNQTQITYEIPEEVCTELDDLEPYWEESGNWKMYAECWVSNNWIGNRVGSKTHAWKEKSQDHWVRKRAEIEARIDAKLNNDDCDFAQSVSGLDQENQERVDVVKWKLFKKYKSIINYDIKSYHKLQKGGTTITKELKIKGEGC